MRSTEHRNPTERFVDALCEALPALTDEQRVRLEDLFNDAVEARMVQSAREERQSREDY